MKKLNLLLEQLRGDIATLKLDIEKLKMEPKQTQELQLEIAGLEGQLVAKNEARMYMVYILKV